MMKAIPFWAYPRRNWTRHSTLPPRKFPTQWPGYIAFGLLPKDMMVVLPSGLHANFAEWAGSGLSLHLVSRSAIRREHISNRRAGWVLFKGMRLVGLSHSVSFGTCRRDAHADAVRGCVGLPIDGPKTLNWDVADGSDIWQRARIHRELGLR